MISISLKKKAAPYPKTSHGGIQKRFRDGKVIISYKNFLGFEKGPDGNPKVVEREAQVIRLIYKFFMQGMSPNAIAADLNKRGIATSTGKTIWHYNSVVAILTNEKYKGDALLQKTFVEDFLTHKEKKEQRRSAAVLCKEQP